MAFSVNMGPWGSIFAVPSCVVDEHIKLCGTASLKALLILLRSSPAPVEIAEIATLLGLSAADTRDALNYWIEAGILTESAEEAGRADVKSKSFTHSVAANPPVQEVKKELDGVKITTLSSRPKLTSQEIAQLAESDSHVQFLLEEAQRLLSKLLTRTETESIVSLYSYNGIPADVLLMVLSYCVSIGKTNMHYFAKTACNWLEQGVDTHEKAEEHIKALTQSRSNESAVRSAFGYRERRLSQKEKGYIERWFGEYGFDISMIKLAYERTVDSIGDINFAYTDKILRTWHEKGFTNTRQAAEEKRAEKPQGTKKPPNSAPSYDLDEWKSAVLYGSVKD